MIFSYSLDDDVPKKMIEILDRTYAELGLGLAADFFSWARHIPTSGPKMIKNLKKDIFGLLESELEYTKANYDPGRLFGGPCYCLESILAGIQPGRSYEIMINQD